MDFKVEVSLWNQPAGQAMPRNDQALDNDFKNKLGLDSHQSFDSSGDASHAQNTGGLEHHLPTETDSRKAYRTPGAEAYRPQAHSRNLVELYALGLYAGSHLSHTPSQLSTVDVVINPDIERAVVEATDVKPISIRERSVASEAFAEPVRGSEQSSLRSQTDRELSLRQESTQKLLSFLTQHWPERNLQLLRRGENGLELVVRDYHLAPAEQREVAKQLQQHVESLTDRPERLWINGQLVWQRIINA